jgi:hypothetical protein
MGVLTPLRTLDLNKNEPSAYELPRYTRESFISFSASLYVLWGRTLCMEG